MGANASRCLKDAFRPAKHGAERSDFDSGQFSVSDILHCDDTLLFRISSFNYYLNISDKMLAVPQKSLIHKLFCQVHLSVNQSVNFHCLICLVNFIKDKVIQNGYFSKNRIILVYWIHPRHLRDIEQCFINLLKKSFRLLRVFRQVVRNSVNICMKGRDIVIKNI